MHSIDFIFEVPEIQAFNSLKTRNWLLDVVKSEHKVIGEIVFILVSQERLLEINVHHLNHDYYTDIITFDNSFRNTISGELLISVEMVEINAKIHSTDNFLEEFRRVLVHGILHLVGYNDKTIDDASLMREKENFYLRKY